MMALRSFVPKDPPPLLGEHFQHFYGVLLPKRSTFVTPVVAKNTPTHHSKTPSHQELTRDPPHTTPLKEPTLCMTNSNDSISNSSDIVESSFHNQKAKSSKPHVQSFFPSALHITTASAPKSNNVKTKSVRKCLVCKKEVRGHSGPYGKNKCKNRPANNGEFLESSEIPMTIEVYATPPGSPASNVDDYVTPPRISIPAEVVVTPPPLHSPISSEISGPGGDQETETQSLHASTSLRNLNQTNEREMTHDKNKAAKPNTKKDANKKAKKNVKSDPYFGPLMRNLFARSDLSEPMVRNSKTTHDRNSNSKETSQNHLQIERMETASNTPNNHTSDAQTNNNQQDRNTASTQDDTNNASPQGLVAAVEGEQLVGKLGGKRKRKTCGDEDCLGCKVEENCKVCETCLNPRLKLKCVLR